MSKRIFSIDVFRAVTMLLMIFVNDFWSLENIPGWLEHAGASQDFLGFSDIIFPCFLFIVGMSIPYAIRNRIAKGDSHFLILYHILLRTVALLVMGVFTVNIDSINDAATGLSREWFQILMIAGFFLTWNEYPKEQGFKKILFIALQLTGILFLFFLFFLFKGGPEGKEHMSPQWWGILGLIGWTYIITAVVYLFTRKSPLLLLFFWLFFIILNIAEHVDLLNSPIPGGGAFQGFAFAGIAASLILDRAVNSEKRNRLPILYISTGIVMIAAGIISHNFFIISKIQATPTWVFICNGIAFGFLAVIYFIVDLKGKVNWFTLIKPAGTSTLTCYLIPYVFYSIASYMFVLPSFLKTGVTGLIGSLVYAFLIIGIAGLLGRLKIRLKI